MKKQPWLVMRNKPNFPCAFVRLKNRFCNELPSRAEGAFDALRVLFCKAVIYFLLMPTITMNPKSFWNRIRVFNILTFLKRVSKGRWFGKADWRAVDSPKKQTDKFDLLAVKSKKANKTNSSVRFSGGIYGTPICFEINWPLHNSFSERIRWKC